MDQDLTYWMQDLPVQNFGDFLSQFFMEHLFFVQPTFGQELRIVGSCIDDMFVPAPAEDGDQAPTQAPLASRPVFWGCGLRSEGGLSDDRVGNVEILSVRGPLTRSALRLGNTVPIGDPGLLLPALHKAARLGRRTERALLIPHFHDTRPDAALLALSGCDEVLRPNIANDLTAITDFIERVVCADFVLSGAMHGAIVAAAYGRPFAFWDSGNIDLPFKWHDFAASLNIPCLFQADATAARAHYAADIAPVLKMPVLWPMLLAAPLPVRPDAFISVIELDISRHGVAALDQPLSSRGANKLQARLRELAEEASDAATLRRDLASRHEEAEALARQVAAMSLSAERLAGDLASHSAEAETLRAALAEARGEEAVLRADLAGHAARETALAARVEGLLATQLALEQDLARHAADNAALRTLEEDLAHRAAEGTQAQKSLDDALDQARRLQTELQQAQTELDRQRTLRKPRAGAGAVAPSAGHGETAAELAGLHERVAWLAREEARLHEAVQQRNIALSAAQARLHAEQAERAALLRSTSWRITAPLRAVARRVPRRQLRRVGRLLRLAVTFQLAGHLRRRRQLRAEIAMIAASPLFEWAWYAAAHPEAAGGAQAAAQHYVFTGAAAGFAPNRMFDGGWYGRTYPAGRGWVTALADFIAHGAAAGHDPHPLFETAWYAAQNGLAVQGGAAVGTAALLHYLQSGAQNGAAPNHLFHVAGYVSEYGVPASGLDPVEHYLVHGASAGHDPHPLFDTRWYVATYPEVAASGIDPLAYYLRHGKAAGHDCTPLMRRIAGLQPETPLHLPHWSEPEVSIVVPAYGHFYETVRCLHAIAAHSGGRVGFETILADDNPANPIGQLLAGTPGLHIIANPENLGFLRTCNRAAEVARGWHIVFLNNDTVVMPDWLEPLVSLAREEPQVGIVGCKLLNPDLSVQEAGGIMFSDGWGFPFGAGGDRAAPEYNYLRDVDVVTGAAFLVRRSLFQSLGGFDQRYVPAFYEEFDLAFEARRAGYRVVYQPRSEVVHLGSSSYGAEMRDRQSLRNHAQFCRKWAAILPEQPVRDAELFTVRDRTRPTCTVLMIDDKVPEFDRHAGALTIFQYIGLMRRLGMKVVFAPADGVAREPYTTRLRAMGVEVIQAPLRLAEWLERHGRHVQVIWTARPDITQPLLDLLRASTSADILYYPHDLHFLRERRRYELEGDLYALGESHRLRRVERDIFARVDCVMTPSAEEAGIIGRLVPDARVRVVPAYLYPAGSARGRDEAHCAARDEILFIGGFKHPPNEDAALWLVREIMPIVWRTRPDVRLTIVGDAPTEAVLALAGKLVEVTGFVPDLAPFLARARLCVAPLRYGAGVKGKIVTALQAGVPVVTTAIGNEGIQLRDGEDVLLGETPETLAEAMLRLLGDPALCARLSAAGAAAIDQRFSERLARKQLLEIIGMDLCQICGRTSFAQPDDAEARQGNWTERLACASCSALNRTAAVAEVLLACLPGPGAACLRAAVPALQNLRMHEFSVTGPIVDVLQDCRLFTCSEFVDGVAPGQTSADDILCQDLQRLTFRDAEFDLLISQDVFEHVPDAARGFAEVFRVLKPGGRHVFTVPYSHDRAETLVRAELTEAGIRHILPPQYHGDPVREAGSLAFREFGRDLHDLLVRTGFEVTIHDFGDRDEWGGSVAVFDTVKPVAD